MLAIRMQRTGRKGHAQFRVVVQDSRRTPTSGRIVALLGNFNPHTKEAKIDKEKAEYYLKNGAQPSDRVVRLLKAEGVKLPSWVKVPSSKERSIRNQEKLRKNRPAEEVQEEPAAVVEETTEEVAEEQVAESTEENETPAPDAEETEEPKKEEPEA